MRSISIKQNGAFKSEFCDSIGLCLRLLNWFQFNLIAEKPLVSVRLKNCFKVFDFDLFVVCPSRIALAWTILFLLSLNEINPSIFQFYFFCSFIRNVSFVWFGVCLVLCFDFYLLHKMQSIVIFDGGDTRRKENHQ